jgi:serine/threonine protein kinase
MTPEHWEKLKRLFDAALRQDAVSRDQFLSRECGGNRELQNEVERMLAAHEHAGSFMAVPATPLGPADEATDLASIADPLAGRVLSHYRIEARLGSGGMGLVYRATDLTLGRAVAIKLLSRHLSTREEAKARFLREARAASALDHPNIGVLYDIGEEKGELFIVMALYEGETLSQRLAKGRFSIEESIAILQQVLLGLEAAHRSGIVHRDIKPGNLLVTSGGTVKILGLAKLISDSHDQTITQAGQAMGTVSYMSPEQLRGASVDSRSDLWSLGVVAYELLAGTSPFKAESSAATAARILNDESPGLANVPGIPDWPAQLVSQLLRKNPSERPQTASEVLRGFECATPMSDGLARRALSLRQWFATHPRGIPPTSLLVAIGVLAAAAGLFYHFVLRGNARSLSSEASSASVAVLPFASLSTGEENAYFALGFHDELLRQLGRIGDLRVISRTSVMQYKESARNLREIAQALGVSTIVEGSVQRAGNRVRVEARLIDARNDRQMWGDRYDRDLSDLFGIQTAVAEEIASALHARLSATRRAQIERKPTQSPHAYDLYLRGLEYANRPGNVPGNLAIAERFYRQAIEADSSFALARARLAYVKLTTYWSNAMDTPDNVVEEAREQAEESLRLQPDLPEGRLALGLYYHWGRREYEGALKELELAQSGLPAEASYFIGAILRRQGRFEEGIRKEQEALRLDPRSLNMRYDLVWSLVWTRRYEEAEQVLDQILGIAPDFPGASIIRAIIYELWKGDTSLAKEVLRETRGRLDPRGKLDAGHQWIHHLLAHNPREALSFLDSV